jgi:hypothetical protein
MAVVIIADFFVLDIVDIIVLQLPHAQQGNPPRQISGVIAYS